MSTLINICGEGRSGSTMLDLMVGHGNKAFSCGEVYAWFRPWRTHHYKIVCGCGEKNCPVWEKIKDVPEWKFHANVCNKLNVDFVVDSSKELNWLIDTQRWAKRSAMSVYNVLVWKTPQEMAFSHWKRNRSPLAWRNSFVHYHNSLTGLGIPFVTIPFRKLTENPSHTLQLICKYVGMPYFEGQEDFWNHQSHHLFGSMGTRKQVEAGESVIRSQKGFTEEFEAILPELNSQIVSDQELQNLLIILAESELSTSDKVESKPFERPLLMPLWYYVRKTKIFVRRYFPQKWHLEQ